MKISQGKLCRAKLEFLKKTKRENYSLENSVTTQGSDDPTYVQPGSRGDLYCTSAYLSASPISLSLVRGVLWCEWFTILWSKELLWKSGVRFLVSTIEARVPVGIKQDINLNSPFPLLSELVTLLLLWWIWVQMSLLTFSLLKTFSFKAEVKVISETELSLLSLK